MMSSSTEQLSSSNLLYIHVWCVSDSNDSYSVVWRSVVKDDSGSDPNHPVIFFFNLHSFIGIIDEWVLSENYFFISKSINGNNG